jgi:tryptophan 7-halogenase
VSGLARIAVVGSGIAAWMASAYLARQLKRQGTQVVQIPAGSQAAPPVVAALPSLGAFHDALAFDLRDLMRACGGSFRLGTAYAATGGIHAYGETGQSFGPVPFHLAWRAHMSGLSPTEYGNYSLATGLARSGRFAPPGATDVPGGAISPGLHLEGGAYLDFLRRAALHYGVKPGQPLAEGELDAESGAVRLEGGEVLDCDLVLDTRVPGGNEGWVHAAPLPARISVTWASRSEPSTPLGLSTIHRKPGEVIVDVPMMSGVWRARILAGGADAFVPGWHAAPWQGRCVRIGDAACRLPPGEAPELRIVQAGLETLMDLLPAGSPGLPERSEYNERMGDTFRTLSDLVSLPFLDPAAGFGSLPDSLALRLRNFTSRGRIVLLDGESFNRDSWASALIASGWTMRRADAHAAALPAERVRTTLQGIASTLAATCETLPDQRTFLKRAGILRRATTGAS